MPNFKTEIYIYTPDGDEHEIPVTVDYDATYQAEYISGPPEDCYPAEGDMTINSIEPVGALPDGVTLAILEEYANLDLLTEEAWDHYHSRGVDDDT